MNKTNLGGRSTIKNRLRYVTKKTDYRHRHKMLKNYEKIYRLFFLKKNKYCVAALYDTKSPEKPDFALMYLESRFFNLKTNLKDNWAFGVQTGHKLNELHNKEQLDPTKIIVLDLKNKKKIVYADFIAGIKSVLNPDIKYTF